MPRPHQSAYWDRAAGTKRFTHPVDFELLSEHLPSSARVLDYGCGYGRVVAEFHARGWSSIAGYDTSSGMIERARRDHPGCEFLDAQDNDGLVAREPHDLVLLMAVLTCVPADEELESLVAQVTRCLRPGGFILISDVYLQTDARNHQRYTRSNSATWGVFDLEDGVTMRHFPPERLRELLSAFEELHHERHALVTMNGNPADAFRSLWRLRDTTQEA